MNLVYKTNYSILASIILFLSVYLLKELLTPLPQVPIKTRKKVQANKEIKLPQQKKFSFYRNIIQGKNIFTSILESPKENKKEAQNPFSSRFILIGIASSGGKNQALIRDITTGRDYYCFSGDIIEEETRVKEILPNKVILEATGKIWELKL